MLSFYLGSFYCFLFYLKSVRKTTCTKIMQKLWCSKLLKYYNKMGQIVRRFLLFLVLYIRFLFESLKLIKQFSSRFDYFLQFSLDIVMLKRVEIFQHFSKIFTQLKIIFVPRQCFLFFYLPQKELVFLNKSNYSSCSKWLKYYIKMLTLKLNTALLYRSGSIRDYFLYKAPIYLPIEDIKRFGQNGWSVQTWSPDYICFIINVARPISFSNSSLHRIDINYNHIKSIL